MDMTEEQLIEKVFDLVKDYEGDVNELLRSATRKVLFYQEEEQQALREKNKDELNRVANEIFELCPVCNFIPVAIETQCEDVFETEIDFERIWESCYDYLLDKDDNKLGWVMPYQDDDMTLGNWKKVAKLWKEAIALAGFKHQTSNDGDYCEFYHLSVNGFCKKTRKIEWAGDINR